MKALACVEPSFPISRPGTRSSTATSCHHERQVQSPVLQQRRKARYLSAYHRPRRTHLAPPVFPRAGGACQNPHIGRVRSEGLSDGRGGGAEALQILACSTQQRAYQDVRNRAFPSRRGVEKFFCCLHCCEMMISGRPGERGKRGKRHGFGRGVGFG